MLVKKINPEWKPVEQPDIKVGETREITNAEKLILNGDVVAVDKSGNEISAYELFGKIIPSERREFEEWLRIKKATAYKAKLEREEQELKEAIAKNEEKKSESKEVIADVIRAKRIAALEKARAVRAANAAKRKKKK